MMTFILPSTLKGDEIDLDTSQVIEESTVWPIVKETHREWKRRSQSIIHFSYFVAQVRTQAHPPLEKSVSKCLIQV